METQVKQLLKIVLEKHPKHKKLINAVFKELQYNDEYLVDVYKKHGYGVSESLWLGDESYVEHFYCKYKKDIINLLSDFFIFYNMFEKNAVEYVMKNFAPDGHTYQIVYEALFNRFNSERSGLIAQELVKRLVLYNVAKWYVEVKESLNN